MQSSVPAETDLAVKGKVVRIGDMVTVFLQKTVTGEKQEEGEEAVAPQEMLLIAEGNADTDVYMEPTHVNTQVFRCLFRIEKARQTPAETSGQMRREDSRNAPKVQDEEEDYGRVVVYGDQISLRHFHSGKLLAFVSEPKWQVQLAPLGPKARFILTVQSVNIHTSLGDLVKYQDSFSLVFKEKNVKQFLTMKAGGLDAVNLLSTTIAQTCNCRFMVYEPYEMEQLPSLNYGSIVTISSKKLKMYMTGTKMKGEPTRMTLTEAKSVTTLKALDYSSPWKAVLTHTQDSDSLWIIENTERLTGGPIFKGDKFHLKHASSEQYLGKDFNLYQSAPTDFWFSTPGMKRGGANVPLRTPDTVILLTSDEKGFEAEQENTLKHFWQDMISSSQQGNQFSSQQVFGMNLKAVSQVQEAEENQFEISKEDNEEVAFYKSVLGYRSKIAEARAYLDGYQSLLSEGKFTLLRVREYVKSFVFPNVAAALSSISSTLKSAKSAEHLTRLQNILVNLKMHKEILSILDGLISHHMDNENEDLLKECQNALQSILSANKHSCDTMIRDSYSTMFNILKSPDRFHLLLSIIMDTTELDDNTHSHFLNGMLEVMSKKLATEGINGSTSILKTLERMCKGVGKRFDQYRKMVFDSLHQHAITSSLLIFEHENCFVTCIMDRDSLLYFSLHTADLAESGFFNFVDNYLSLITVMCESELQQSRSFDIPRYTGLSFAQLKRLAESSTVSFTLRATILRLLSVLTLYENTPQAEFEDQLEQNCWLYGQVVEKTYEETAFTLFRDTSQELNQTLKNIEELKRMEMEFWVSDGLPSSVKSEYAKNSEHFLEYIMQHLKLLEDLLARGHIQRYYLACIFQALSDALLGLVWGDSIRGTKVSKRDDPVPDEPVTPSSQLKYSSHWTSGMYPNIKVSSQKEGQRFKLQQTYYAFIRLLERMIRKSKLRKLSEILDVTFDGDRSALAMKVIQRNWAIEDLRRYSELNLLVDPHTRLLASDNLSPLTIQYLKKLIEKNIDFVEVQVEMMAAKSPFLEDNSEMLNLVKGQNSQDKDIINTLLSLEPMTEEQYREIMGSIQYLTECADSKTISSCRSLVSERLLSICGLMYKTYEEKPDSFKHMQVTLRKLGVQTMLRKYWKFCFDSVQSKDDDEQVIISRVLALSRLYVAGSSENCESFMPSLDWQYFLGQFEEFHEFMFAVNFAEYLGYGNLLQLLISAVHIQERELATQIIKFLLSSIEKDKDSVQLRTLIINVLHQIIDELLLSRGRLEPEVSDNLIFLTYGVLEGAEEANPIFEQLSGEITARVDSGDDSFSSLGDFFKRRFDQARRLTEKRIRTLIKYDLQSDVTHLRRTESTETDPTISFISTLRLGIRYVKLANYQDKLRAAITEKFKTSAISDPKGKLFKAFVNACCRSFMQGTPTPFLFNLLQEQMTVCEKLPSIEGEVTILSKLKALYSEFGVIESAYNVVIGSADFETKQSALNMLNTYVMNEGDEIRTEVVNFLKEADRFFPFFTKCLDLMKKFKQDYTALAKVQTGPKMNLSLMAKKKSEIKSTRGNSESLGMLINYLKFFRYMSDVCFVNFQELMRVQESYSGLTVNMIAQLLNFIYEASCLFGASSGTSVDDEITPMLTEAFQALSEAVSGPNIENQILVGANSKTYLSLHRVMSIVQERSDDASQELHLACLGLYKALMECRDEPPITVKKTMNKMLTSAENAQVRIPRWQTLFNGIKSIYDNQVGLPENEQSAILGNDEIKEAALNIGISQCIFLVRLEKMAKDKNLTSRMQSNEPCLNFYLRFIGYVEISKKTADPDKVEIFDLYFPIPFEAKFLTLMTEGLLIENARRTSQQDKIDSFISKMGSCKREMLHQQFISRYSRLKAVTQNWELCSLLSFALVVIINVLLLCYTTGYEHATGNMEMNDYAQYSVFFLAILQVALKMSAGLSFLVEYWPHLETIFQKKVEINITDYYRMSDKDSQYISSKFSSLMSGGGDGAENLGGMMQASFYVYNYVYYIMMITALFHYNLYPVLLVDIIYQFPTLITILKAVTLNAKTLILTAFFALVVIFIFTTLSFMYFSEYYDAEQNILCGNLFDCFWTTLYFGIRSGGGVGDFLEQASPKDYWVRMVFDMFFYVVIIIVMLNIVFGIIIDTFGDLRDRKREAEEDINNVCFICGQDRNIIDLRGEGWMTHFMSIHSPFAYLSFLVYLDKLEIADCTGLEKYVKEMLLKKDTSYFPPTSKAINANSEDS